MAKEAAAEQAVEKAIDVSEEAIEAVTDAVTEVATTFAAKTFTLGLGVGLVAGGLVGYLVARKRLETKYDKIAQEEISEMREHYLKKVAVAEPKPDLDTEVERLGYASKDVPPGSSPASGAVVLPSMPNVVVPADEVEQAVQEVEQARNVFEPPVWNHEVESASRTSEVPYVIHKDEFEQGNFQGEPHGQTTLTYFVEDDVLIDESDAQIPDIDGTIGLEVLERFGHGSGDPDVVYVRNHQHQTDFRVQRSMGSFAAEVHGITEDDSLEHSAMRRHRSRRSDVDES